MLQLILPQPVRRAIIRREVAALGLAQNGAFGRAHWRIIRPILALVLAAVLCFFLPISLSSVASQNVLIILGLAFSAMFGALAWVTVGQSEKTVAAIEEARRGQPIAVFELLRQRTADLEKLR